MSTLTMHFLQCFTDLKLPIRHVFISVGFSAIVWLGGLTPTQAQTYRIDGEGFALADNGITVVCDDAEVGDTAELQVRVTAGSYVVLRVLTKIESKSSLETFGGEYSPITVCTSGLTDLSGALKNTSIDDVVISTWDVSSVTNMHEMFRNATDFDQDLSVWDVSSVTDMSYMFQGASTFNNGGEPLTWTTSGSLLNIRNMFKEAVAFNQQVGSWDVSNVTNMQAVFNGASSFNRELKDWNVAKVEKMQSMFGPGFNDANPSVFNKDISGWDVSSVTTMKAMFKMTTNFNKDISKWDVSSVTDMDNMFYGAENFNKDLSGWCVSKISSEPDGFATDARLTNANKPVWGTCANDDFYLHVNEVTVMCPDAEVGESGEVGEVEYTKRTKDQITTDNAAKTCTSGITDMNGMFRNTSFNQDISSWDVSSVKDMSGMFHGSSFNQDIGSWDVSSVTDMQTMFDMSSFNKPIGDWDVSSVENMRLMFRLSPFDKDIGDWDVSSVTDMDNMFAESKFDKDIGGWDVSSVTDMDWMFAESKFDKDIRGWDVSKVTTMQGMFNSSSFNQDIGGWDVSSVTDMSYMFLNAAAFNQDLSGWCVSSISSEPELFATGAPLTDANNPVWGTCPADGTNSNFYLHDNDVTVMCPDAEVGESGTIGGVTYTKRTKNQITTDNAASTCTSGITNMYGLFDGADSFNGDISTWDVSQVKNMGFMFKGAVSFSGDLSKWDISSVTTLRYMFWNARRFNSDISQWDIRSLNEGGLIGTFFMAYDFNSDITNWDLGNSSVTSLVQTFRDASSFNQNLGLWDVQKITNMNEAFAYTDVFNQDLSEWCVVNVTTRRLFATGSALANKNKPVWGTCPGFEVIPTLGEVNVSSVTGDGATISSSITDNGNDVISEKGFLYSSTDSTLESDAVDLEVTESFSHDLIGLEGNTTYWVRSYARNTAGVGYSEIVSFTTSLQLSDDFYLHDNDVTVMCADAALGDVGEVDGERYTKRSKEQITTENAATTCTSGITDMKEMFYATDFNQDIGSWDVSSVADMSRMFLGSSFNKDIGGWDVSSVTTMQNMFGSSPFNKDIGSWDVSSVNNMSYMFISTSFNQDISSWVVSSVTDMSYMFYSADAFNQDIGSWDVSSVKNMHFMFYEADSFNQDIGKWDVSSVTDMVWMFTYTPFNQDLSKWDVSSVIYMGGMFASTPFNQDLSKWDVSSVTTMQKMFLLATDFNQDLSEWCVPNVTQYAQFDDNSGLNEDHLPLWERCPVSQISLRSPAHEAAKQPLSQTLSWASDARAESYTLEISTDNFATKNVPEELGATDTTYALSSLDYDTEYKWRVRAANTKGKGHTGQWSDTRSFTTRSAPTPDQPGRPTMSSPSDGATGQSTSLTLNWNEAARATSYTVQVSDDNFSSLHAEETVSGTSASITGLAFETTYKWRVIGNNQAGQGDWSPTWSFSTEGSPAPGQVTLSAPADGATGQSYQPTLSWQSVPYASTYQVQVSANGFSTTLVDQTTSSTQFQASVDFNSTYEWRVRASNDAGEGPWSETRSFSTRDVPPPGGVTLKAPADGSTGVILPATLQWEATNYASSYDIELRAGGTVVENTTLSSNTVEIQLEYETTYSWRVKARNANGASSWSESWSFSTAEGLVDSITVIAPKDGAANVSTSPELSWQAASNAVEYHLEVSDDAFATTMLTTTLVGNTSHQLSGLEHNHTYHWRLRGANETGNGPWTPTMSFKTQAPSTAAPTLLSPAQNAQDVEIPTVFAWEADPNATAYEIELFTDALLTTVFSFDVTDTTYTYGEMEAQKDYLFRVRAKNASGTSNWANVEFKTGDTDEVGTSNESWGDGLPRRFGLEQNYPNPFNPSTVIRYAVPQASQVRLMVFDMMGREVATLVRGTKSAGYHEVVFDASHLGSGAYMYRLEAGDVVLARTLYLIK